MLATQTTRPVQKTWRALGLRFGLTRSIEVGKRKIEGKEASRRGSQNEPTRQRRERQLNEQCKEISKDVWEISVDAAAVGSIPAPLSLSLSLSLLSLSLSLSQSQKVSMLCKCDSRSSFGFLFFVFFFFFTFSSRDNKTWSSKTLRTLCFKFATLSQTRSAVKECLEVQCLGFPFVCKGRCCIIWKPFVLIFVWQGAYFWSLMNSASKQNQVWHNQMMKSYKNVQWISKRIILLGLTCDWTAGKGFKPDVMRWDLNKVITCSRSLSKRLLCLTVLETFSTAGLAMYNGVILDVRFPLVLYKKLLGLKCNPLDLMTIEVRLFKSHINFFVCQAHYFY